MLPSRRTSGRSRSRASSERVRIEHLTSRALPQTIRMLGERVLPPPLPSACPVAGDLKEQIGSRLVTRCE